MTLAPAQIAALAAALDAAAGGARLVYLAASIEARDAARQAVGDILAGGDEMIETGASVPPIPRQDFDGGGFLRILGVGDGAPLLVDRPDRIIADPAAPRAALDAIAAAWAGSIARRGNG